MPILHQFLASAYSADATTDFARLLQRWLGEMGIQSEIYAGHVDPTLATTVRPAAAYRPSSGERALLYHHCTGDDVADRLVALNRPLGLIYHNITPPEFFSGLDPVAGRQAGRGREQLAQLRPCTRLALGVSPYNVAELDALGFRQTAVLPLTLDAARYQIEPDPALLADLQTGGPALLFVGRIVPNKRQEDLIKLLYHLRRRRPSARLFLVGDRWFGPYADWLETLADELGLADAVRLTGRVSHRQLVTYYRGADLYISMSEHEGFGKPFLESMHLGLPVLAYAAAGVPGTLGRAGLLFKDKDYPALAELVDLLLDDAELRRRLVAGGRERVRDFSETAVRAQFQAYVALLLG